ncbi:MAG: SdrD B-like domain-containing protein [Saprospiraceae bacterium]
MLRTLLSICVIFLLGISNNYAASLDLIKTVDDSTPLTGETFTYTLQYRCASTTEDCNGVVITDPLPASVEYVGLSGSLHTTNETYNSGSHTVTFTLQDPLTAGTVGQVTVSVRFPNGTTPNGTTANNTATISASNAASVNSSALATASAFNSLSTHKYYSGGVVDEHTIYGIEVCNDDDHGSLNMTNITIVDNLPANTIFVDASYSGVYNAGNHSVTWTFATLDIDECNWPQVTLIYPSSSFNTGDNVSNLATVSYTPLGSSQQTEFPSVSHTLETPWIQSYIKKTGSSSMYIGNDYYYHYFNYYNNSNVPIDGFYLEDLIPADLEVKNFETGNFYIGGSTANIDKYVKYKTNLNSTWTNVSGSPMDIWDDYTIQASSLGLGAGEYITGLRWEFGPDPWPISGGLSGSVRINYEVIPNSAPVGFHTNCITASGDTITWMNYSGTPCKTFEIKAPLTGYTPSPRKGYAYPAGSTSWQAWNRTGHWFNTGDVVSFRLRMRNNTGAGGNMDNPAMADLLPIGLEYVDGSWSYGDYNSGASAPSFVKTDNYKNTGRTHLRWDWPGVSLAPSQYMYVYFDAVITSAAGSGEDVIENEFAILNSIENWCSISGNGDDDVDVNDIDNDGDVSEKLCFAYSEIDITPMPALSSEKYVKGQLDSDWTKYPNYGNAVPGGVADYRLILRNDGNVAIDGIKIVDILPFVGDAGVIDLSQRDSRWRPNLAGAVSAPPGVTVYYSTEGNPCRSAEGIEPNGPVGCQTPNWSTSVPADITTVQSLKFDFGSNILLPSDSIVLEWPMRAPVNTLTSIGAIADTIAWASFGYIGTRVDNDVQLLAAEPLKVGIRMEAFVPAVLGDQVWIDTNQDGIQNNGEIGIDGLRVELYEDNGDGIANPSTDNLVSFTITGNGGFYLFPNLPADNYFLLYYLLPNYDLSNANQGNNDALDSDGTAYTFNNRKAAITPVITLGAMDVDLDWDLGIYPNNKAAVGDYVWIDDNANGLQDESSSFGVSGYGLNGYTVNLYQSSNQSTPFATTMTTDDLSGNPGYYLFEDLTPGDYLVEVITTTGVTLTTQGSTGSSDPSDSDANTGTGRTEVFNLSTNEYDNTWDFGLIVGGVEICDNLVDDDGDNLIDCDDPDCSGIAITNVTVGSCIDHPYADITTLDVTVSWSLSGPSTEIEVRINNKTEYIDIPNGAASPFTVSFVVPADGSSNNSITANYKGYTCETTSSYNAPNACSSDQLDCTMLYICGDSKGGDADAFDHGLMQYIDGINGSATLDGALAKNDASGLGLYDPNNTSTLLNINVDNYNIILVSSTTWGDISSDLKTALKNTPATILLLSQDILVDLAMAGNESYSTQTHAYSDNTTLVEIYNYNNSNPHYDELIGWGNYHINADAYLWKDASNQSSRTQGVFFDYTASDNLGSVPSNHGGRIFLGYMMDGVYWNDDTNMGATPVPQADWFDPIRHLTQSGKLYLDQAIEKASNACAVEDCTNGVDDDGDGLIDCDDSDCQIDVPESISND